jgi:hypothetical protein
MEGGWVVAWGRRLHIYMDFYYRKIREKSVCSDQEKNWKNTKKTEKEKYETKKFRKNIKLSLQTEKNHFVLHLQVCRL